MAALVLAIGCDRAPALPDSGSDDAGERDAMVEDGGATDGGGMADAGADGSSCTPVAGDDVTCDGVDDDCSGAADEGYASTSTTCGVGACAATGATTCVDGAVVDSCTAGTPAADDASCNDVDDDCDGTPDQDFAGMSTTCGVGACAAGGVMVCVGGVVSDTCMEGTPAADETLCDGLDEDCDGTPDEMLTQACTRTNVWGTCSGTETCTGGAFTGCTAALASPGGSCVPGALELLPSIAVDGFTGTAYSLTVTGAGGSGAGYTWAVTDGALPPGLTLGATGVPSTTVSGTPTATGAYLFTVTLTDSSGASVSRRFTIHVRAPRRWAVGVGDEIVDVQTEVVVYDLTAAPPTRHRVLPAGAAWPAFTDALTARDNFAISPDGTKLAFVADASADGSSEVWVVDLAAGPTMGADFVATKVSSVTLTPVGNGDADQLAWSPNSRLLAYTGDLDVDGQTELYLADVTIPTAPGTQQKISPTATTALELATANAFFFSPSSEYVALRGDFQLDGRDELYVTYVGPASTFTPVRVNADIPGTTSSDEIEMVWWIPHRGDRLIYTGEQDATGVFELYMADVRPTGTVLRYDLSGPLVTGGDVSTSDVDVAPSPDGTMVFYVADQRTDIMTELFVVDVSGGGAPGVPAVTSALPVGVTTFTQSVQSAFWSPDSTRIAYTADVVTSVFDELFLVEVRTPRVAARLNPPLTKDVNNATVIQESPFVSGSTTVGSAGTAGFTFSPDGTRVAFVAGDLPGVTADRLFVADLTSASPVGVAVSQAVTDVALEVSSYLWAPDSRGLAYVGDQEVDAISELYFVDLTTGAAPTRISRSPIPASGDVSPTVTSVFFRGDRRVLYRGDDRLDNALEVTLVDFTVPSAIVHTAVSTPAATASFSVTQVRVAP